MINQCLEQKETFKPMSIPKELEKTITEAIAIDSISQYSSNGCSHYCTTYCSSCDTKCGMDCIITW